MDVEMSGVRIHPHAVHKKSIKWLEQVFTRYHMGHKASSTGKPVFIAPVAGPWQCNGSAAYEGAQGLEMKEKHLAPVGYLADAGATTLAKTWTGTWNQ